MKKLILSFILAILLGISAFAANYDFSAVCESGQRLYYKIKSSTSPYVEVTYQSYSTSSGAGYSTYPTGDLTIPSSVTYNGITYSVVSIDAEAFRNCSGLTSVTIPNSVVSIFSSAFKGCSGLVEMTIPFVGSSATATTASESTLFGYIFGAYSYTGGTAVEQKYGSITSQKKTYYIPSSLRSVTVTGGNMLYGAFYGCSMLTTIIMPNSVTSIGNYAFYNCNGLSGSLTIPNSVTSIGNSAFRGCSGLTGALTIPDSVTSIGQYAFYGCSGLTGALTIPNSVTSIGVYTFHNCSGLTSVTIPNSVTSIGSPTFQGCSGLVEMTIPFVGGSATATESSASTLFGYIFGYSTSSQTGTICQYNGGSSIYAYIPSSLRSVTVTGGNLLRGAFYGCSMLTSVAIPNSVTSIGDYAFFDCSGLTSVTIPNSVTSIGYAAFSSCSGLRGTLTIPNSVTSIGQYAFGFCTGLTSVTIGNGVTSIGDNAFNSCSGLRGTLTIPNSVTSIGDGAFRNCSGLSGTLTIPNSVTSIGGSAFFNCSGLTYVTIGNSVTSIGMSAFMGCSRLASVTIGNSVTSIGSQAFLGCCNLTVIYANPATPPTVGGNNFNYNYGGCEYYYYATVWVPCGSAAAYLAADEWGNFSDIRETGASLLSVSSANLQMGTASITLQPSCSNGNARIVATPNEGYRFVQWNDGNTDNPRSLYVSSPVEYVASFEAIPTYTITAVSADEATGTVTGGGIFYEGETATLTATAAEGYRFATWNDGNTDNPRTITVTEDATYTATFTVFHTITVTSADETQGTASGSGDYAEGSQVEISATPAEHYHFTQWNDGNTDNPRTITVTSDSTFTASFAIDQHTVTVESADTEMGTVSEGGTYDYGTEIQISATPAEGYGFATWNDGNTDNPRTITVTEDITYTATFGAWRTITVLSADETMGTVSGGGVYVEGAQVEISAEAVEHYHFAQWNDGNTDNPRTITVAGDSTFTASFAIDRFTITVESADEAMGTVSESNTYDYGTEIQISATAAEHYHFVQWNDGNTDNPRTITVTGDATYIATFAPNNYTIVVRSLNEDWGTVSEGGTFPYGTEIQISATPRENYAFVAWTDGNTDNPRTITVVADAEYTAAFTWSVGIDETAVSEIALFPNPATDILNITSSETISEIEIVNVMGQVVKRIEVNSDNAVCDVNELTSGVYVVRIHVASATLSQLRFVKE